MGEFVEPYLKGVFTMEVKCNPLILMIDNEDYGDDQNGCIYVAK